MSPVYTADYALRLLERAIADRNNVHGIGGAAKVAAELATKDSLICQLRSGAYPQTSCQKWYRKIVELYGNETVPCPEQGKLTLILCAAERVKPMSPAPSAGYVRQRLACLSCKHNMEVSHD